MDIAQAENVSADRPPYDAWLLWMVPDVCNLGCLYCPTGLRNRGLSGDGESPRRGIHLRRTASRIKRAFRLGPSTSLALYRYRRWTQANKMPPVDINALLKALAETGRVFRVGFTGGGEPLLIPNIIEAAVAISRDHYLGLVSNLTSPRVRQLAECVDPSRAIILASTHIQELERKKLLDRFVENFLLLRERGFNVVSEVIAHPSLLDHAEAYRASLRERGVDIYFGPFKGEYEGRSYPEAYSDEDLSRLGLQRSARAKWLLKGELCNAGYNAATVRRDGLITPCFDIDRPLGHVFGGFRFEPELRRCPVDVCTCPLNRFEKGIFRRALQETGMDAAGDAVDVPAAAALRLGR